MPFLYQTVLGFRDEDKAKFKLYRNQGVRNFPDADAIGVFSGNGALRCENITSSWVYDTLFLVLAPTPLPKPFELNPANGALRFREKTISGGEEIRVSFLVKLESQFNEICFSAGNSVNGISIIVRSDRYISYGGFTTNIPLDIGNWYQIELQGKYYQNDSRFPASIRDTIALKMRVYLINVDGLGNFVSKTLFYEALHTGIYGGNIEWGGDDIQFKARRNIYDGANQGTWIDNIAIGQGNFITDI